MKRFDFYEHMRKAFALGQEYWRLSDSDHPRDWSKADQIKAKFEAMIKEIADNDTEG